MPTEASRLQQPIGPRDKRLLGLIGCAAVLALPLGLVFSHGGTADTKPGCIRGDVAGVMGGGTISGCGADARALCKLYAARYPAVAAQCAALRSPSSPR
jgi:hypothetical protein